MGCGSGPGLGTKLLLGTHLLNMGSLDLLPVMHPLASGIYLWVLASTGRSTCQIVVCEWRLPSTAVCHRKLTLGVGLSSTPASGAALTSELPNRWACWQPTNLPMCGVAAGPQESSSSALPAGVTANTVLLTHVEEKTKAEFYCDTKDLSLKQTSPVLSGGLHFARQSHLSYSKSRILLSSEFL